MKLLRKTIMLCLLLVWGSSTAFSINYQKEFGDDWTQAEKFVKEHRTEWKQIFEEFEVDADIATAIVQPSSSFERIGTSTFLKGL